ncbi:hypothetical protein Hypma_002044 [Hypsizygus marmoreus]|uniref:Uncharacterized protein n=1 Tax=Hypsizygus marmoreus TaxID=39966 RepID=A0A369J4X6_HYPMA|nr:hypothetical protein Hypma_002044 [Hypsizygus marmoreus]
MPALALISPPSHIAVMPCNSQSSYHGMVPIVDDFDSRFPSTTCDVKIMVEIACDCDRVMGEMGMNNGLLCKFHSFCLRCCADRDLDFRCFIFRFPRVLDCLATLDHRAWLDDTNATSTRYVDRIQHETAIVVRVDRLSGFEASFDFPHKAWNWERGFIRGGTHCVYMVIHHHIPMHFGAHPNQIDGVLHAAPPTRRSPPSAMVLCARRSILADSALRHDVFASGCAAGCQRERPGHPEVMHKESATLCIQLAIGGVVVVVLRR